jgi:NAD(P)-dependent dehydrogenase (short-subunit alcohol dehydrogenase family)
MSHEFAGRVAVVTGASRGIGRLLVRRFAEHGARVAFAARSAPALAELESELTSEGFDVLAVPADVGNHEDCARLVAEAVARFGRVDILVNNAGMSGVVKPIQELSYEEFDAVVRSNLYAAYSCIHFAAPHMIAAGGGAIVNVSSGATRAPHPSRSAYSAGKRGMTGVTAGAALDLGPHGIRCNTVSPGAVAGERLDEVIQAAAAARGVSPEVIAEGFIAASPLRSLVEADDICETILFLCSDASRHITGQDLGVNAGVVLM